MIGTRFCASNKLGLRFCLMALGGLAFLSGCGSSGRDGIAGTVTLDGKPLEKGYVTFRPQSGTASPSAGANVTDGRFSVAAEGGLLPGKFRVEITASRLTNKRAVDPFSGKMVTLEEQYIPAKYNSESKLEAEVRSSGPNRADFALTSR